MRKFLILLALTTISFVSFSQREKSEKQKQKEKKKQERRDKINALIKQQEEGALIFTRQTTFGLRIATNGYGFNVEFAKMKTPKLANFINFELGEIKHPKEKKSNALNTGSSFFISNSPFVYGKQNIFYQFRMGFGQHRVFGIKGNRNGVAVHFSYSGGISLGLLRPYYITVDDNGRTRDIKYSKQDSALFLGQRIIKGTGLKHGWPEMQLTPGVYGRGGIRFDWGQFNELVSALEVGVTYEYYFKRPEMMLLTDNKRGLFSAYVSLIFGSRR